MTPKVYLHMPNKMRKTLDKCHLFEDRPFSENLYKMFNTIGLEETKNIDDASFVLTLYAEEENTDLILDKYIEVPVNKDDDYKEFVNKLNAIIKQKPVLFVDLFFPNGGSLELLEDINYKDLKGITNKERISKRRSPIMTISTRLQAMRSLRNTIPKRIRSVSLTDSRWSVRQELKQERLQRIPRPSRHPRYRSRSKLPLYAAVTPAGLSRSLLALWCFSCSR